jgi:hypothetical protein
MRPVHSEPHPDELETLNREEERSFLARDEVPDEEKTETLTAIERRVPDIDHPFVDEDELPDGE